MTHEKTRRIQAFLEQVQGRLTPERFEDVAHDLREEEWHLAVWMLAEYLDEQDSKLSPSEWDTYSELAESVDLDPRRFEWLRAEPS